MSRAQVVIFSKDRTLQLKSLLRSIRHYSDIDDSEISVLYTTRPDIPYDSLLEEFRCNFVRQTSFLDDVRQIVEGSDVDYVLFMVDDLIFRDMFRLRAIEEFLDANTDVDCFSLRLGRNIQDGPEPDFSVTDAGYLVWDTSARHGRTWKYFWELSSSVYRTELTSRYLRKCDPKKVTFPNPLETHYYGRMPSHLAVRTGLRGLVNRVRFFGANSSNRMACYGTSKCFTQGVNLVANRDLSYETVFEPLELHQKMLDGLIVDYVSLEGVTNTKPNAGSGNFRLTADDPQKRN